MITWLFAEGLAPYFEIRDGKPAGFIKDVQDFVEELTPEYGFRTEIVNIDRVMHEIEHGDGYCFAAMAKIPRREEIAAISGPVHFSEPHALLVRAEDADAIGDGEGGVRLDDVLTDGRVVLGANLERTYGSCLDEILARHKGERGLYAASSNLPVENFARMLLAGRIDAFLEYPMSLWRVARSLGIEDKVRVLEVRECGALMLGHVGCSRTDLGRGFVSRLDATLDAARGNERHRRVYAPYVDESRREVFERHWREFLAR